VFAPRLILSAEGALTSEAIAVCLAALTHWNAILMRASELPGLYASGVRYREEPGEDWRDAIEVLARGAGDCEDLACYRAAELQISGEAGACAIPVEVGRAGAERQFHIVVRRANGRIEDPSAVLGMR
jgi:hypothetical protein